MKAFNEAEHAGSFRKEGFSDALKGIYRPEFYAKGWALDAYREGKNQAVIFTTLGNKA